APHGECFAGQRAQARNFELAILLRGFNFSEAARTREELAEVGMTNFHIFTDVADSMTVRAVWVAGATATQGGVCTFI
ncbi:MAG: hypothetical protein AAB658_15445, partial [Chloroflexota bacterium]